VKLGKGVTNLFSDSLDEVSRTLVEELMRSLGAVEWFEDERLFQAAGILTGAGPAFLFRFIDALADAGAGIGLAPDQAERLATAMVEGAASLAASEGETPAALADRVASPGGTTRAGLNVLDSDEALNLLVRRTLEAGLARSKAMAKEARRGSS
jgi:pyrroline-5-carboxylate reductase